MYKTQRCTASGRPNEESAQSEFMSIDYGSKMNDATNVAENTDTKIETPLDGIHGETQMGDREDGTRQLRDVGIFHEVQNQYYVQPVGYDSSTLQELTKKYRTHLSTVHRKTITVPHRRWSDSIASQAAGAALTDRARKYWVGPTIGNTALDRIRHRRQKATFSNKVFTYTLAQAVGQGLEGKRLSGHKRALRGGGGLDKMTLFTQYTARLEQLPTEEVPGYTRYTPKHRSEFDKMSRKRQLLELRKVGVVSDSVDEAVKLFIQPDARYPDTHTTYATPLLTPASMKTAEILHHQHHLTNKIGRLRKLRRESKREATIALRRRRRDRHQSLSGQEISIGTQRAKNIYLINRSISEHVKVVQQLEVQLRRRLQLQNKELKDRYVGDDTVQVDELGTPDPPPAHHRRRGCRHHTRFQKPASVAEPDVEKDKPTFLQELRRSRIRKWEKRSNKVHYRSAQDRVGGFLTARCEELSLDAGTITVCTMNVRGFGDDDNKLEMILQFCQDESIDVMVCIDAQLDEKRGHWYGKICKRRLGVGTRTNVNPCMVSTDGQRSGPKHRVGGIFTIIGPKWGTSLVNFQKDKFGIKDGPAGVMSQVTLATSDSQLNIIGTYWPNKNETTDMTLWNTLNRYVHQHRLRDSTPIDLLQRVSQQWIATAFKNGARGSILCGDLNATWTGVEPGGQTILQHWADSFSLNSGVRQVARRLNCDMYTRGGDGQPQTWIDHMLHKGSSDNIAVLAGYTSQAPEWVGFSDHKPIWGVYKVHPPLQKCPKARPAQKVRYELHLTDKQKCDEFVESMETLLDLTAPTDDMTDEDVMEYMRRIEQHSAHTVKRLYQAHGQCRHRSSRKNGWSPMYIAFKAQLTSLVEIRRHVMGHAHRSKWNTTALMLQDLPEILELWETTVDGLGLTPAQYVQLADGDYPLLWWKTVVDVPNIGLIDNEIDRIKKSLHGTARTEMRRRISVSIRSREDSRRDGKWKKVIGSLLGHVAGRKHQAGIDLDMITTDNGIILGDPEDIHQAVTNRFEDWFDIPDECQGDLHEGHNWRQCRDNEAYFVRDTAHTGAPEEFRRLIHRAIANVPRQKLLQEELRDKLREPPTLADFEAAIQHSKTNSSAGISGCSYNQLKKWPPELIKRVHYCLCRVWRSHLTPDWWPSRWLVVIPKKQEEIPNVSNMRPLILVEAVRKIWCKLLLHRILDVWGKHNVLHRYQHGFIHGRSTMTASTLFINMLEDAVERGHPLHTCTWDITKAFDSVTKNVMKLAWTRLGVPDEWVQWLVGLDEKGTTTVRTPHAIDQWNKDGPSCLRKRSRKKRDTTGFPEYQCPGYVPKLDDLSQDIPGLGFQAIRGTGQGDVTSPTCWAAIFDILLTALHMDIQETRAAQHVAADSNQGYSEGETAYADDLLSCARTPEALQRKADIVSTFCLIMGLQLSTTKLRRFVMAHSGLDEEDDTTIVHLYGTKAHVDGPTWDAIEIQASTQGTLEYLGGKYDTDGSARTIIDEIKEVARTHCAEIGNTAASALTKLKCSNMTTYAKIRYSGKLASTTLAELAEVDKIFYKFHAKTTKNMMSFPYDLMYQRPEYGGVGLQRYSDLNSIDKLSEMFRSLRRKDEVSMAMGGLLQRMARVHGHEVSHGYKYRYAHKRGHRTWMRSACEWLDKHNLHLWRGGSVTSVNTLSSAINFAIPGLSIAQKRQLRSNGIAHMGDIIDDRAGTRVWSIPDRCQWLLTHLPDEPIADSGVVLWPGQYWQPYVDAEGVRPSSIIEIMHVLDDQQVVVGIWRQSDRKGTRTRYTKDMNQVTVSIASMFHDKHTERWDAIGRRGNTCSFARARLVPSPKATIITECPSPPWVQQVAQFCSTQGPTYKPRIYTDGSYTERDHDLHSVFDTDAVTRTAAAGIAIVHDGPDWKQRPMYAIHIDHGADIGARSAYTMEYLALAMAMRVQGPEVRASSVGTDSMAVLKRIRNRQHRLGQADESHRLLLQSIDGCLSQGAVMPTWIPSHPERRKPDVTTWTMDDWGNHLADKIASKSRTVLRTIHPDIKWTTVTALEVIGSLPRQGEYYFGDMSGRPSALHGITDHVHQVRRDRYTAARDLQRDGGPKWMDNTIQFAAKVYNGCRGSSGQYAHTARMIWDKHWHGRNRSKQRGLLPDGQHAAAVCHMCDTPDSQHHCFRWCNHSNVRAIREETSSALRHYEQMHSTRIPDETLADQQLKVGLIRGVIHEFHNCADAGRVWTGNWNSSMVTRVQTSIMADRLTETQCRALRSTLHELYDIIAQGANDIMDVRHGVRTTLDAQQPDVEAPVRLVGQRPILDYFYNSRGMTGVELSDHLGRINDACDPEDDISIHSDNSLENNAHWQDECTTGNTDVWPRDITADDCSSVRIALDRVAHITQRITTVGKHVVSAGSLKRLTQGLSVDSSIVDGYLHMLQERNPGIKCMGSSFFSKLYNPAGHIRHMPRDTFNMGYASQHFNAMDISRYRLILIPVLVKQHWTLIVVDLTAKHIRYLNSGDEGGSDYLTIIKRWLANRWTATAPNEFKVDEWRCLSSHADITPQQADTVNCGIFTLMFAECIVMGKDITSFSQSRCQTARWHIAKALLDHDVRTVPSNPDAAPTNAAQPPVCVPRSPRSSRCRNNKSTRPLEAARSRLGHINNHSGNTGPPSVQSTKKPRDRPEISTDIESLNVGGWLTDTVINDYFQLLQLRNDAAGSNHAFLSAHFLNRLYDPISKAIRPQYHATANSRNAVGLTDLDVLREMHQHNHIFHFSRVYIPVAQPHHWGLLEVDNVARRITYMDSLHNGGGHYAQVLGDYLTQYEIECTGQGGLPWAIRSTIHPESATSLDSQVRVPRQTNGNDCGVFVCMFADLLDRHQDLMQYRTPDTPAVRAQIRCSLQDKVALSLTAGPQESDSSPCMAVNDSPRLDNVPAQPSSLRQSVRSTRYMGSMAEDDTALNHNHRRLAVKRVPDMGWCLFALEPFSHSERAICTYHGRHITARQAKAKSNKSRYIVELKGDDNQYRYIDGYDAATQLCYSAGPYANDGINWSQRRDLWNAELAPDDYNPDIFVLRPLRDIKAGEQIYVWYGPRYWCSDDHSAEHMAMAVMTYGIDIDTSTEAAGSYGNWLRLSKIQALRQILADRRYTPPPSMADITNIKVRSGLLVSCILESTDEEIDLNSLPNPTSTPTPKPRPPLRISRFRAGTNPIAHRKMLLQEPNQHEQVKNSLIVTDKSPRVDRQESALTAVSDNISFAPQLEDSNVTAPDAIDDQQQPRPLVDQGTQDHVNLTDASIRRSKRTFTQALLPDSYRTTRSTRHRWSS